MDGPAAPDVLKGIRCYIEPHLQWHSLNVKLTRSA